MIGVAGASYRGRHWVPHRRQFRFSAFQVCLWPCPMLLIRCSLAANVCTSGSWSVSVVADLVMKSGNK